MATVIQLGNRSKNWPTWQQKHSERSELAPQQATNPAQLKVGLIAYNWEADTSLALWNLITFARQNRTIADHVAFSQYCAPTPKSATAERSEVFKALKWIDDGNFDVVGFSCYIWNIDFTNRLAQAVKEIWPRVRVVYGGQQIRGFYVQQVFERERCVDICVIDEAEKTFQQLMLNFLTNDPPLSRIPGLAYWAADRDTDHLYLFDGGSAPLPQTYSFHSTGEAETVRDLASIPSPYLGEYPLPVGGAFLYEASRGCPYACSFCIWGEAKGVREYPMDRVVAELESILKHQPSHIMFCDGTFNMRKGRAAAILQILVDHLRDGRVQPFSLLLELKLELIDESLAQVLDELIRRNPLVTVEFGMQSSSQEAARLMRRPFREDKYRAAWGRLTPKLQSSAVIDCIYGLPGDGVQEFKATVDFAYSLAPHRIQCFRLSILPGSEFERQAAEHNLRYAHEPNHVVYETAWVTLDEMMWLETFGHAVADLYHFHGNTVRCLLGLADGRRRFSDLVTEFVDWTGQADIINSSYDGNTPDGRWRAINLTKCFERFVFEGVLPDVVTDDHIVRRVKDLFQYEAMMGKIAMQGLPIRPLRTAELPGATPLRLGLRAEILRVGYDIPSFILRNRGKPSANLADLVEEDSHIALTVKAGHEDVHVPISYRVSARVARLIERLRDTGSLDIDGRPLGAAATRRLRETGLIV